jgi:chromate reductase, NAD(P)H dehydrogenase (quinone)
MTDRIVHVLAISGSLRRDSYNTAILRAAREIGAELGLELELYEELATLPHFNQDRESDPPVPVAELRRRIADADAVFVVTPEYNHSIPGALKDALDWASRPRESAALAEKPAAAIGASTGAFGAAWAQAEVRKVLAAAGANVLDRELPVTGVHGRVVDGELVDDETRDELRRVLEELRVHVVGRTRSWAAV